MHAKKKFRILTQAQREELLLEWNLFAAENHSLVLEDFHRGHKGEYTHNDFLRFLRQKLETEGYWKQGGQS